MIRIAVIGDIGSGKSYVAKQLGYPVFNADKEVAKLYKRNKKCYKKLKKKLPLFIFSFPIKKNEISRAIIEGKNNLKTIIKVVHPEINLRMKSFIKKNRKRKFVVLDIPLLMENKINKKNDILLFIEAPKKEILKRLKKRPNINFKIIKKFKKIQLPIEFKKNKSNYVIKNNFNNLSLKNNVKKVLKKILLNA